MSDASKVKLKKVDVITDVESPGSNSNDEEPFLSPRELTGSISYLQDLEELPQGRHLGLFSTIILFVSRILGTGIFSISSGIYEDCGRSAFLFFLAWSLAAILSFCGLYVFLELGSLMPRSGGIKVFLEFIYERPKLLASVSYSIFSVLSGFTISNCLVFGEYILKAFGIESSDYRIRLTGLVFLYLTALIHGLSIHHGVFVQNAVGALKLILMGFMVVTGSYVLFFPKSITHIESQLDWNNFFTAKTDVSSSSFASAVIKASFAYSGWNSVHTVSSEIKNPIKVFKIAGPTSLTIITITYLFTNLAYLIVIPEEELVNSRTLVGGLLFEKLFGKSIGSNLITFSIAACAGGNIFVVLYTISRVSQEAFREGYMPFSSFMSSNWPKGAPFRTLILSVTFTTLIFIFTPSGDVYGYIVAMEGYPNQLFIMVTAIGLFILRRRYPDMKAPIRSTVFGAVLTIAINLYLLASPFLSSQSPNPKGLEHWPSCAVLGLSLVLLCVLYWYVRFALLPKVFGYELISEDVQKDDGLIIKKWIKVYR